VQRQNHGGGAVLVLAREIRQIFLVREAVSDFLT
jgi:hypothetical protein